MNRVADPVIFTSGEEWLEILKTNDGQRVLMLDNFLDNVLFLIDVSASASYNSGYHVFELWSIDIGESLPALKYEMNHRHVSKEIFYDQLKINYPDYFQWILFHPEYM